MARANSRVNDLTTQVSPAVDWRSHCRKVQEVYQPYIRGYIGHVRRRQNTRSDCNIPFSFAETLLIGLWIGIGTGAKEPPSLSPMNLPIGSPTPPNTRMPITAPRNLPVGAISELGAGCPNATPKIWVASKTAQMFYVPTLN